MNGRSQGVAYLCWCLGLVGLCGIHRFYAGKWISGLIWLLTGGLLFIGQIVDLFLIPGIIRRANEEEYKDEVRMRRRVEAQHG